ncbi:MAG: acyltransferase family protein [Niastella sp.]|uniref:acyltransferase family protein n=1 Tax=Niastella sp. TaxID=1869183 RepID=UPI00389B1E67
MIPNNRFISLDVFRGLIICLMIIVNTPGSHDTNFAQLEHADWNGFTLADLVFPSFLFAVGNALFFSMQKWKTMTQGQVLAKIGKRTLLLFIIGYLLHWFPFFETNDQGHLAFKSFAGTRIMGILQRIALCYGMATLMIYYLKPKGALIVSVLILIAYQFMLLWFGEPGHELEMAGNAVTKLDLWLLGPNHMNHGEVVPFEHEGLLSTLPAITNVVAGYLAGWYIQTAGKTKRMLAWLIAAGAILTVLGLCWNVVFPINKNLWTSSFVLYSVGLDCLLLAGIIYITDFLNITRWTWFFEMFGKNALFIYLLSEVMAILLRATHLYKWIFNHIFIVAGLYTGSLLFAIWFMLMCWLTGLILDKRKIYIRV